MKNWTEFHIGLVYYASLTIAFIVGIMTLMYLRASKKILVKITGKTGVFWNRSFFCTVLMAGVLGALSVTFNSCESDYTDLLNKPVETLQFGFRMISTGCLMLAFISVIWFVIFVTLRLSTAWRIKSGPLVRILAAFGIILCLLELYDGLKTGLLVDMLNPFKY